MTGTFNVASRGNVCGGRVMDVGGKYMWDSQRREDVLQYSD